MATFNQHYVYRRGGLATSDNTLVAHRYKHSMRLAVPSKHSLLSCPEETWGKQTRPRLARKHHSPVIIPAQVVCSMCNLSATNSHQSSATARGALHFRLLLATSGFAASRPQTMSFSSVSATVRARLSSAQPVLVTSNTQRQVPATNLVLAILPPISDPPSHEFAKHVKDDTYTALMQNSDYNANDSHHKMTRCNDSYDNNSPNRTT